MNKHARHCTWDMKTEKYKLCKIGVFSLLRKDEFSGWNIFHQQFQESK